MKASFGKKVQRILSKREGDSQIVVALVLIAVAVGLCIIFRKQINNIMIHLFEIIGNQINALTTGGE